LSKKTNVGLIGYGMAGSIFHAPVISSVEELSLRTIVEPAECAQKAKERYPWVNIIKTIDELLDDSEIDLVVIAVPNKFHYELAKKTLLKDKHVVLEKPFTITSQEADELIELAKKRNRILSVHHNRRWDGDFKTVKKVVESKVLGDIVEYQARFDRFRNFFMPNAWREKPENGSGVVYDLGVHLIDQAQHLFGLPETITADIRVQREGGKTDDSFLLTLDYGKVKVSLGNSMLVKEPLPHFVLLGTKGSYVKYGEDPQEEALKNGFTPLLKGWGEDTEKFWGVLNAQIGDLNFRGKIQTLPGSYQDFYKDICKAINNNEQPAVKAIEARNNIRIIELALLSSKEKRTVKFT